MNDSSFTDNVVHPPTCHKMVYCRVAGYAPYNTAVSEVNMLNVVLRVTVWILPHYSKSHLRKTFSYSIGEPALPLEVTVQISCKEYILALGLSDDNLEVCQNCDQLCVIEIFSSRITRKIAIDNQYWTVWEGKLGCL